MKQKVIITSRSFGDIGREAWRILEDAGIEGVKLDKFEQEQFSEMLPAFDALIIGAHPLMEADIKRSHKLKIICKHGAGVDNIPVRQARDLGIIVTNAPGTNSNAVADLAFSLILTLLRQTTLANIAVRRGEWKTYIGCDVYKKRLGLIGFGAIARNMAMRAAGFSMDVSAYDPFIRQMPAGYEYVALTDMQTLLETCDIVSLHLPLTPQTHSLIGARELSYMKRGSYLINTSRGGIVDERALYEALTRGHISGAGLDVLEHEPPEADYALAALDNVIVTPHIGMYSREAISMVSEICARNVVKALRGGIPDFVVEG